MQPNKMLLIFQIISYDSSRGGVSVIVEKGDVTTSNLVIQLTRPSDAGTYTCRPSLGNEVAVNVHILRGAYSMYFSISLFSS